MKGYFADIEEKTLNNNFFRSVLYTGKNMQLVVMSLAPGEDIGTEVHPDTDQFFRVESGNGVVTIDGEETEVKADDVAIVPAGSEHNVKNTSDTETLKVYTIYAPPNHKDGTVHKTKAEAVAAEEHH
jgi:mannose-6-phosphate isomerase-like protein (cupin superfamily)